MPVTVTYPGVYLQEIASGNHTVTPVSTSITGFVGRAPQGPTDLPVTIFSYGDYTRAFGGLSFDYPMSYAVQDFFANGGAQAIICRLFEPNDGSDGCAGLRFAGGPPALTTGCVIDQAVSKGATSMPVWWPASSEGEPDVGQTFTINGDNSQTYLVTLFTPADTSKKQAASIAFLPPLARSFQKCTPLAFGHGPAAAGWSVAMQSKATVTLQGGNGIPELGDTLTFGNDPTTYAIIAEPEVTGASTATMQVKLTLAPAPAATIYPGSAATIGQPQPLPMPVGWEVDIVPPGGSPTTGSMTLINGSGAPQVGDQFQFASKPGRYAVTKFVPADPKTPATMSFVSLDGTPIDGASCHCCAPVFRRPAPVGWGLKSAPKLGATSLTVAPGPGATGVVDVGDSFMVAGDQVVYMVRAVDPTSGTVYFLPKADQKLASAQAISFQPPLTLRAANPGAWGNFLRATADTNGISAATAKQFGEFDLTADDLFNLTLILTNARGQPIKSERFANVAVKQTGNAARYPNRLDRVLASQSNLARVTALSALPPAPGATTVGVGGDDGTYLAPGTYIGDSDQKTGLYMLEHVQAFNLLCVPPDRRILPEVPDAEQDLPQPVRQAAATYCTDRRAFFIVDPPVDWINKAGQGQLSAIDPDSIGITGENASGIEVARNAAVYFPRIIKPDLMMKSQPALFPPCGVVAGIMAATDVGRGVWKAPAGIDAGLAGVTALERNLTDNENGLLNPLGINCLRNMPIVGPVVWGARTLRGADAFDDDYKYVPVRRLTLFIENSLKQASQWAVFEPNDEALWSSLRLMANSFLAGLSQQGAFYNYLVACDATTTTPVDIALGQVNLLIQIAPVKPAEFVVIQIQQTAGSQPS